MGVVGRRRAMPISWGTRERLHSQILWSQVWLENNAAGKGHAPEEWRSQRVVQEQDRRVERLILQKMMVSSLDQVDTASCTRHTEMEYHPV